MPTFIKAGFWKETCSPCTGYRDWLNLDKLIESKINSAGSDIVPFTVEGGTIDGTQPTFDGPPLFSGSYIQIGKLVHFEIQVLFTNITSFGTGQYYVKLPFLAKYAYLFRDGCLHDFSTGRQYGIAGHVDANSDILTLWYVASNGRDEPFEHDAPITLQTVDKFHIAGTYIDN